MATKGDARKFREWIQDEAIDAQMSYPDGTQMIDDADAFLDAVDMLAQEKRILEGKLAQTEAKAQRWIASLPLAAIATVIQYTDWNEMPTDEAEADWKKVQAWLADLSGAQVT